jgi:hypothetical protein
MLRFLKKHRKSSKKPVPPENGPVHQPPNIGAGRDTDSEGEYRLRKILELIRPMGTDSTRGTQIPTAEGVLGSQIRAGGLRINSFPHRMPRLRLPETRVATQVSAVGCCLLESTFILRSRLAMQGRGQTQSGPAETRSENEDQGPAAVQQPAEITPELAPGGGVHDPAQPGKSRGKFLVFWLRCYPC